MARIDYVKYHLSPKMEVEKTRHLSGVKYMEAILADMDISELSSCDVYHSDPEEDMISTVELDYDGCTNLDDDFNF